MPMFGVARKVGRLPGSSRREIVPLPGLRAAALTLAVHFLIQGHRLRRWSPPSGQRQDAYDSHLPSHRNGQHVAQPQFRMGFVGRLPVDPNAPQSHQSSAIGACAHEPRAPKPFIQALPVAIFPFRHAALSL